MSTTQSPTMHGHADDAERRMREMLNYCKSHHAIGKARYYEQSEELRLIIHDVYSEDSFVRAIDANTLAMWETTERQRLSNGYLFVLE